jgi:hypothetical protein
MRKQAGWALFFVAPADAEILCGDLDPAEPSPLYAQVFRKLTAACDIQATTELRITEDDAEPFRDWLDRAKARHSKNGDSQRAQAFARVRGSEQCRASPESDQE